MSESRTELPATTGPYVVRESNVRGRIRVTVFAPTNGADRVVWDQLDCTRGELLFRASLVADELNKHLEVSA
jgi:CII-binding regulator of phage lambda lysogenization HflD